MATVEYIKPRRVFLASDPQLSEVWLQDRIAEDPSVLGLGELILKDKERSQPRAGRLDLLLQDPEEDLRYEVEVQLGRTDESHIIRTIEYWDLERKRYPQYDHIAVIVAEDITSRFLNVIGLFNGMIPIIAIQVNAIRVGDLLTLVFTKVLDQQVLGFTDDGDEDKDVTDRAYWESRGCPETVAMADDVLRILKTFDPEFVLKYNKFYIGVAKNSRPHNFVIFRAQKQSLRIEIRIDRSEETDSKLDDAGLEVLGYNNKDGTYKIRLSKADLRQHAELLTELLSLAYQQMVE